MQRHQPKVSSVHTSGLIDHTTSSLNLLGPETCYWLPVIIIQGVNRSFYCTPETFKQIYCSKLGYITKVGNIYPKTFMDECIRGIRKRDRERGGGRKRDQKKSLTLHIYPLCRREKCFGNVKKQFYLTALVLIECDQNQICYFSQLDTNKILELLTSTATKMTLGWTQRLNKSSYLQNRSDKI